MSSPFSPPRFSAVSLQGTDLRMCLLSCPGIRFTPATRISTRAFLDEDLARLERHDVKLVVSCLTEAELILETTCYDAAYAERNIAWHRVSIPDMRPPTDANDRELGEIFRVARRVMAAGHAIGIHCMAGLGRTGTVAALLCMRYGLSAQHAIDFIRRTHASEAIETEAQMAFLFNRQAGTI